MGFFSGIGAIRHANKKLEIIEANLLELTRRLECNIDTPFGFICAFNQLKNDIGEFGNIIMETSNSMGTYYIFMGNKFENPLQLANFFKYIITSLEDEISKKGG